MSIKTFLMVALPVVAAIGVYFVTVDAEFVHDDNHQILDNPWVQELRHVPKLWTHPVWAFETSQPTNYYRPVQMTLYNLLWSAFPGRPLPSP